MFVGAGWTDQLAVVTDALERPAGEVAANSSENRTTGHQLCVHCPLAGDEMGE